MRPLTRPFSRPPPLPAPRGPQWRALAYTGRIRVHVCANAYNKSRYSTRWGIGDSGGGSMLECMELKIMAEWAFIVPRCPSFLSLALSLSLSRSPSLFLSLSARFWRGRPSHYTSRETLLRAERTEKRWKEEPMARDISVSRNRKQVMGRFSWWIPCGFLWNFLIYMYIYACWRIGIILFVSMSRS